VKNRQKSNKSTERVGIARLAKQRTRSCACFVLSHLSLVLSDLIFAVSSLVLSYLVLSCLVLSYPILSYLIFILSCLVLSCLVLPCLIVSYVVLCSLVLSCLGLCLCCLVLRCLILSCVVLSCSKKNTSVRARYRRSELAEIRGAIELGAANHHSENTFVVHDCGSNFDSICAALRKRGYVFVLIVSYLDLPYVVFFLLLLSCLVLSCRPDGLKEGHPSFYCAKNAWICRRQTPLLTSSSRSLTPKRWTSLRNTKL
jgi:hypothetical protein